MSYALTNSDQIFDDLKSAYMYVDSSTTLIPLTEYRNINDANDLYTYVFDWSTDKQLINSELTKIYNYYGNQSLSNIYVLQDTENNTVNIALFSDRSISGLNYILTDKGYKSIIIVSDDTQKEDLKNKLVNDTSLFIRTVNKLIDANYYLSPYKLDFESIQNIKTEEELIINETSNKYKYVENNEIKSKTEQEVVNEWYDDIDTIIDILVSNPSFIQEVIDN